MTVSWKTRHQLTQEKINEIKKTHPTFCASAMPRRQREEDDQDDRDENSRRRTGDLVQPPDHADNAAFWRQKYEEAKQELAALKDISRGHLEENFKCKICLDVAVDPATLPCQHSFCMPCLKEWTETRQKPFGDFGMQPVNCPGCREFYTPLQVQRVNPMVRDTIETMGRMYLESENFTMWEQRNRDAEEERRKWSASVLDAEEDKKRSKYLPWGEMTMFSRGDVVVLPKQINPWGDGLFTLNSRMAKVDQVDDLLYDLFTPNSRRADLDQVDDLIYNLSTLGQRIPLLSVPENNLVSEYAHHILLQKANRAGLTSEADDQPEVPPPEALVIKEDKKKIKSGTVVMLTSSTSQYGALSIWDSIARGDLYPSGFVYGIVDSTSLDADGSLMYSIRTENGKIEDLKGRDLLERQLYRNYTRVFQRMHRRETMYDLEPHENLKISSKVWVPKLVNRHGDPANLGRRPGKIMNFHGFYDVELEEDKQYVQNVPEDNIQVRLDDEGDGAKSLASEPHDDAQEPTSNSEEASEEASDDDSEEASDEDSEEESDSENSEIFIDPDDKQLFPTGMVVRIPAEINKDAVGLFELTSRLAVIQDFIALGDIEDGIHIHHFYYDVKLLDNDEIIKDMPENNIVDLETFYWLNRASGNSMEAFTPRYSPSNPQGGETRLQNIDYKPGTMVILKDQLDDFYSGISGKPDPVTRARKPDDIPERLLGRITASMFTYTNHTQIRETWYEVKLTTGEFVTLVPQQLFPLRLYKDYFWNFAHQRGVYEDSDSDSDQELDGDFEPLPTQPEQLFPNGMNVVIPECVNADGIGLFELKSRVCYVREYIGGPGRCYDVVFLSSHSSFVGGSDDIIRNVPENNIATCSTWKQFLSIDYDLDESSNPDRYFEVRHILWCISPSNSRMNFREGMEVIVYHDIMESFYEKMICLNQEASCPIDSIPDDKRGWVRNCYRGSQSSRTGVDEFRIELRSGRYITSFTDKIFPVRLYKNYWANFKNELIDGTRGPLRDGWWLDLFSSSDDNMSP
tara:strand:- start:7333 stop:10410 length:3078 start_codon:yes stop_codon:yes gene_type:complete